MSAITKLLAQYSGLPAHVQRAVGSIVGAAVADAATRPVHWVYDRSVIETVIGSSPTPEFWPTSLCPFYTLETGARSCYNDEAFAMLKAIADTPPPAPYSSVFNREKLYTILTEMYSPSSAYAESLKLRQIAYDPARREEKRNPIPGPWQHGGVTDFLAAHAAGVEPTGAANHKESDGFCLSIPLIARLSVGESLGNEAFSDAVAESIRVLSASDSSVAHGSVQARMLRSLITDGPGAGVNEAGAMRALAQQAVAGLGDEVSAELEAVLATSTGTDTWNWGEDLLSPAYLDLVAGFGKACAYPGSFQGGLLGALSCSSFTEAVRRNLLAGGCNCSRANFIGACFGAAYGIGGRGVPVEWIGRTDNGEEILAMAMEALAGPS
ncbi:ADP-ribosylation/Crystallin J1 [Ochromonadaceae sp. CCMP2298]|nr:ADP-ribosylation/Crystallin J1 [Ochromonadaceae sp. CCMP2298]|eukprot:CAMPEP_0173219690 /NCGR_PEP_ID=MMETSP1142-20121109/1736_1 /TAXON_ID=483371 /ORGANISM="non described non described, Strain CCMP2298" /LENGTH=380 /DNA_ID=CAMNT_0014147499 /DNA_START=91 /DNA_END=1233 /DNA_ORIENTATION=+